MSSAELGHVSEPVIAISTWRAPEWAAAGELASAAFALLAVAILLKGLSQIRDSRDRFRAEVAPYLRVDLSPDATRFRGATWEPSREPTHDLTFSDINPTDQPLTTLASWAGDVPVFLWVENQQRGAAGVADDIVVTIELAYPDPVSPDIELGEVQYVQFSYLEPGHLNRYLVATVSPAIPFLSGAVTRISYADTWRRQLSWAHGSAEFQMRDGVLQNVRTTFRRRRG